MIRGPVTRVLAAAWLVLAAAVAVAGCGGSSSGSARSVSASGSSTASGSTTSPGSTTSSGSTTSTAKRRAARPRVDPVGATQRVDAGSSTLAVTVTRVVDPLSDSGSALLPGMRAVGVVVSIRNLAGATYDSTASGDWSVTPSTGTASPLFIKRGACQTQLVDFESLVGVGDTRSGCVGFSVPRGARIVAVRFSPHSRAPGAVRWR